MKNVPRFIVSGWTWKIAILLMLLLFITAMIWISSFSRDASSAWAMKKAGGGEVDFLYGFLQGHYSLIGRFPDSKKTYGGIVVLRKKGDSLDVIRKIHGKEIQGIGRIETATADRIKVLRVRFVEGGKHYEVTYLIHSDLNNCARLSGYLYLRKGRTIKPGLESLFMDHQ